jgi:hypothetical protein
MRVSIPSVLSGKAASLKLHCAAGLTLITTALLLMLALTTGCGSTPPLPPTDAQDACPLSAATFAGWFESGSVTLNGAVNPANSLNSLVPNCGFYQWSEQMFLWLNSPAPSAYGGGAHIFDSPAFYDVSPPDASGNRTFLPHTTNMIHAFPLRMAQRGPHRLPVIVDRLGQLREILPSPPGVKAQIRDQSGNVVEIAHARWEQGRLVLLDKEGKTIAARMAGPVQPVERPAAGKKQLTLEEQPTIARKFVIDGIPIFVDPSLAVIDVEQGQAGDDSVLEAQTTANGSLVYYATMVNDVYAYFLTGTKDGAITTTPPNQFPTTATDLTNTINFAMAHGKPNPPFPDPNALAIEVKSSWVEATGLPNLSSYITMTATVPEYTHTSSTTWTQTGQKTIQLAMVGMHVVGSTLGHPEMVWATFEHTGNTPLAPYTYNSTSGPKTVTSPSFSWLFAASGATTGFNNPHMTFVSGTPNTIQAVSPFTISPSDTNRVEPWGIAGSNAGSNTQVISMNNHVLSMLASGDLRANYVMTGATWTPGGTNPTPTNNGVGTNLLANTTMETYAQGSNCFSCHSNFGATPNATTDTSHVFAGLQPLF